MNNHVEKLGFKLQRKTKYMACQVRDGFRNQVTLIRSWGASPGMALFILSVLCIGAAALTFMGYSGVITAPATALKIKLKTEGLDGDNLKFMTDLQARFADLEIPDAFTKEQAEAMYTKSIQDALAPYMVMKEISMEKVKALLDDKEGVMAILLKQGAEITKLKAGGVPGKTESVRDQVAMWVESNKSAIEDIVNKRKSHDLPELKIKAPITMTEGASMSASTFAVLPNIQVMPGIIDLVRVQPTFWSRLIKGATKANPLVWINKYNKQGNAAYTAEGALKSQASFELLPESSVPKKTTEYMKISTEMLNDIDYLSSVITQELAYEVDMSSNSGVLIGTGVGVNPKGVTLYGAAYALPGLNGILAANNADAIRAAIAQLRSLNFGGRLTAYINPIDAAVMDLSKDLNGTYVNRALLQLDADIVQDNNIPIGQLLIGDMSKYHVMMYQDFYIQWGWENQDFTKNLITVIGERRFHQWVATNETGAFIYDTFANIKAALA